MPAREFQSRLEEVLSPEQIIMAAELCSACEVDGKRPAVIVRPGDAAQVGRILALSAARGWAVIPWGSGAHIRLGNVPIAYDVALDLGGLDQVFEYDPDNQTLNAGAGCMLKTLERLLDEQSQLLPLDPPMSDRATLGGVIASNASGPSRLRYGGARDIALGLEVALTTGDVISVGGKTVKNVAGYDLTKLFVGSHGSLGVITRATCRLLPRPEQSRTVVAGFGDLGAAEVAIQSVLASQLLPTRLDLLRGSPIADLSNTTISLVLGVDDSLDVVERHVRDFGRLAVDAGAVTVDLLDSPAEVTRMVRDMPNATRAPLVIRVSLPPSVVGRFWSAVLRLEAEQQSSINLLSRVGVGIAYVMIDTALSNLSVIAVTIQQLAAGMGGHAVVERIPAEVKGQLDVWGPPRDEWSLMRALKARFDPKGVMSPGRFVDRL